jgi:hypothetical protein
VTFDHAKYESDSWGKPSDYKTPFDHQVPSGKTVLVRRLDMTDILKLGMIKVSNPFSSTPPLFTDLARSIAGEIDCSLETLDKYSSDGSPYFIRPQAIVYPKNGTDIKHIISFAREYTMPITVRGNGTAKTGGSLSECIVIDMSRYFNHIRQINMMDGTITVDAGVVGVLAAGAPVLLGAARGAGLEVCGVGQGVGCEVGSGALIFLGHVGSPDLPDC